MRAYYPIPFIMVLYLSSSAAFSQETSPQTGGERTAASRYFLGKENEFLMPVNILGPVNKPGQYMIPSETDVISLVAYAGGFKEDVKINEVKIVRRLNNSHQPKIIKVDLAKFYATGDRSLTPLLLPDDTVLIDSKKSVALKTLVEIARGAAYVAQVIYIIYVIDRDRTR
ncbi:MAG: polysaccharide biosynthesis/export family protein [bacterium]